MQFKAGNERFDAFFTELHELQVELAAVPDRPKELRRGLAEYLDLDERASAALVSRKLGDEVAGFLKAGTGFAFTVVDDEDTASVEGGVKGAPSEDAENFYKSIRGTALGAATLAVAMGRAGERIAELEAQIAGLERDVDKAFSGESPGRRADIRKNLEDAAKLLPLMRERSAAVAVEAHGLARRIEKEMATEDKIQAPKPADPVEVVQPVPGGSGPEVIEVVEPGSDKPKPKGKPAPKPAPKPGPAPKPPGDFEP